MRYFRISAASESACAYLYTPADKGGQCVVSGKPLPDFDGPLVSGLVFPDETIPDLIPSMTDLLTLSCRAASILEGYRLQKGARCLPVSILREDKSTLAKCVSVHFPEFLKALDLELSQFTYLGKIRSSATVPVLQRSDVGAMDLMDVKYIGTVCSEAVKNAVESERLTNFSFEEIQTS